jgi:hypothetical protein
LNEEKTTMNNRKWIAFLALTLIMVGLFLFTPRGSVGASPFLQMTPGMDPMSVPTMEVPTPQPGDGLASPSVGSGQTSCPMMSGSMTASGTMPGQAGMSGMGGMGMQGMGMQGMNMQSMPGMGQMGSMPMDGMQNVNDVLSNRTWRSWFYTLNPWWVLGWVLLFGLGLGLLGVFVAAIIWLARRPGKNTPDAAG